MNLTDIARPIFLIAMNENNDDAKLRGQRQTLVLTPATKVAVDQSVVQPATNDT
jgi:BioD-like phosphotransacetylase family protein